MMNKFTITVKRKRAIRKVNDKGQFYNAHEISFYETYKVETEMSKQQLINHHKESGIDFSFMNINVEDDLAVAEGWDNEA